MGEEIPQSSVDVELVVVWQRPAALWPGNAGGINDSQLRDNRRALCFGKKGVRAREFGDAGVTDHSRGQACVVRRDSIELGEMTDIEQVK